MPTESSQHTLSFPAGADLRSNQFSAVTIDSNETIQLATAGKNFDGVLLDTPNVGQPGTIATFGKCKVLIGDTVSPGTMLAVGANGSLEGSASGATATATLATSGVVKSITIGGTGTGYTNNDPLIFTGGGGTGAAGTITVATGNITAVTISNHGSGYTSAPAVSVTTAGGSGQTLTAVLGKAVGSITVTSGGTGYLTAPSVTITGDGSGATGTASVSGGSVTTVTVSPAGSNYTTAPSVSITSASIGTTVAKCLDSGVNGDIVTVLLLQSNAAYA